MTAQIRLDCLLHCIRSAGRDPDHGFAFCEALGDALERALYDGDAPIPATASDQTAKQILGFLGQLYEWSGSPDMELSDFPADPD